jgi:hypothetical protein
VGRLLLLLYSTLDFPILYLRLIGRLIFSRLLPFSGDKQELGSRLSNPENQNIVKCSQGQDKTNIKRGIMKWTFVLKSILVLGPLIVVSESNGQIPSKASDLPSLSNVRWGMKMHEVKERINGILETDSDSTLHFDDSFLQSKVRVILTFEKYPDFEGLKIVEVQFDDKNLGEKLFSYLKARYGEKFENKKQEKTKLFITVQFETKKWTLEHENIMLITFSKGIDILALNLLYRGTGKNQK